MHEDFFRARVVGKGLERLRAMVGRLREPGGCPWDREQTLASLKPCLVEEAYELLDAMEGPVAEHEEELGDVLLQVVFQARVREENGDFNLDDVAHRVSDKLLRRHPHVFGDVKVADSAEVVRNWETIKKREKLEAGTKNTDSSISALDGVPPAMPALARAQRTQAKAARVGFDWPDRSGVEAKLSEEIGEYQRAVAGGSAKETEHELGDILLTLVNLCRFLRVDAEIALRAATNRFEQRFRAVEQRLLREGRSATGCSIEELDRHWQEVKKQKTELTS